MQLSRNLIISLVICAAIFCAGCTQNQSSSVPVPSVTGPVPGADTARLALTQSDLPQGYTMVESRAKTSANLSKIALELGWREGYVARFTSPAQGGMGENEIVQSIAIYPERIIPDVITIAEKQERSDNSLVYTDLTVRGLGINALAFSGKASQLVIIKPTQANPILDGINVNEAPVISKSDFVEIIFSKGDTFEVFRMTGPSPDAALLEDLAQKAYAKIP